MEENNKIGEALIQSLTGLRDTLRAGIPLEERYVVRRRSLQDGLDRIHEAGGKAWDDVEDPDKFIRELRGDIARDELTGEG